MKCNANKAAHLSNVPKVNGQQNLTGFVELYYQSPWMVSVDMLVTSAVERCFRLGLNYLIPLKLNYIATVLIIHTAYCSTYIHRFIVNIYK